MAYRMNINSHIYNAVFQIGRQITEAGIFDDYCLSLKRFNLALMKYKDTEKKSTVKSLNMSRLYEIFKMCTMLMVFSVLIFIVEIIWFQFGIKY